MSLTRLKNNRFLNYVWKGFKNRKNDEFFSNKNIFRFNSYGNYNEGTSIYNILIDGGESGFFAILRFILDALYVANICGFDSFIQVMNTKYNVEEGSGDNMFEYYFEQPSQLTLDIINGSSCVIEYNHDHRRWLEEKFIKEGSLLAGYEFEYDLIREYARLKEKYIKLKAEVQDTIDNEIKGVLNNKKTLGVHFRGNAFSVGFAGHPKGLTIDDYSPYIDEAISLGYERIFVATDEQNALDLLKNKYGEMVVFYEDTTRSSDGIDVQDHRSELGRNGREIGFEVLRDMMTLSSCDGFICGKSQVSFAVMVEKERNHEQFKFVKVIDKGVYSADSKKVGKYLDNIHRFK